MPDLTEDDIRRAVSGAAFLAGRDYERRGDVGPLHVSADRHTVETQVRGSARRPYRLAISLAESRGGTDVIGACSCPVGLNCKHVAAALLAALKRSDSPFRRSAHQPHSPARSTAAAQSSHSPMPSPSMPPDVAHWLHSLEQVRQDAGEDYPPGVCKRLLYIARHMPSQRGPDRLEIGLASIEVKRDGSVSDQARQQALHQLLSESPPRFVRPSDRAILRQLSGLGTGAHGSHAPNLLRQIIATGRGRWGRADGPALREGPSLPGRLDWQLADDGTQRLVLATDGSAIPMLAGAPWYVEPVTGETGPLELDVPPILLGTLLAAPAVPPAAADQVGAELSRRLPGLILPAPQAIAPPEAVGGKPTPCLTLFGADLSEPGLPPSKDSSGRSMAGRAEQMPLAALSFRYAGVSLPSFQRVLSVTVHRDGRLYRVTKDLAAEVAAEAKLREIGLHRLPMYSYALPERYRDSLALNDEPEAWIDVLLHDVPALRSAGWQVDVADSFPLRLAELDGDIIAEIRDGTGIDWFDLHLGAVVDGERIDLVPMLLGLIASGSAAQMLGGVEDAEDLPLLLRLPDGRLLNLPAARMRPILATLLELHAGGMELGEGGIRLARHDAALLAELDAASAAAGLAWQGGQMLRDLGRVLREHGGVPAVSVPDGFRARLRPYQQHGVDWMAFLGGAGLGGVLADDMGLGKTVQALALLTVEHAAGRLDCPALVVCPTSLVPNWRAEAARFAPTLRVLALHGPDRRSQFDDIAAHDLVITTYPLLFRDGEVLTAQDWSVVLLDEAHGIKNPAARTAGLARRLRARQRIALTGTPLENHLGELWSLMDWVLPGFLGTRQAFARTWRTPIERGGDTGRRDMLARRVRPFLLRRTKGEVAADLPPRTEIREPVELGDGQRAVYEGIRLAMHQKVAQAIAARGLSRAGIIVLDALLKLRQACCDLRLLKLSTAKAAKAGSAKLDRLMELLPALVEDGRRVLVFSQFTSMLALIGQSLEDAGLPYVLLTGQTQDRETPVRRFQAGEVPLFLISLKAGGVGLNLTAADTVVHYDPWWNPAAEDQATDRAHRIGQDKPVFVHRLVALGTVEERMEDLKARKRALATGILEGGEGGALALTEADIEALLTTST